MTGIENESPWLARGTVGPLLPKLEAIEGLEVMTELTRVGRWQAPSDREDASQEPNDDATSALREFRAAHDRRHRLMIPIMFVFGASLGICMALAPHARFFHATAKAPVAAPRQNVPAPADAPVADNATGLAMAPLDIDAIYPSVSDHPPTLVVSPRSPPRAHASAPRAAAPSPAPATKPATHKAAHVAGDDDAVKNAQAADDLARAQLTDSL